MSAELRKKLDQIAERDRNSTIERMPRSTAMASLQAAADSQADVPVLLGIINAALTVLDDYDVPSKEYDTTGDICSGMERLEREVLAAMEAAAT